MIKANRSVFQILVIALIFFTWGCINKKYQDESLKSAINIKEPAFPEKEYNVIHHGVIGDGVTLDTEALQSVIDLCHKENGGTIYFPPGLYRTGTLRLHSNIRLHIERGAVIRGSSDLDDYPAIIPGLRSYTDNYSDKSIIYAEGAENIAITGEGIIDGVGWQFPRELNNYKIRPYLVKLVECEKVLVEGVTLLNPAKWAQHYLACDHLTIRNITVSTRRSNFNGDGLDVDACHHVWVTGAWISAQDDAIVFKSTLNRSCENILVENCTLSSMCNALKFGTESNGGFKNITVRNCHIYDTNFSGLALEVVDGGIMDGILISDITMNNVKNPFFIRLGNRARPFMEDMPKPSVGVVRNITIRNVVGTNIGKYSEEHPFTPWHKNAFHIPSPITGIPGHPVENVFLENISMQIISGHAEAYHTNRVIPEKEDGYPEFGMFGQLPAYGFYLRHARNIHFNNVNIKVMVPESRQMFYLDKNVSDIFVEGKRIDEQNQN